jgi:hypothetical protein
MSSKALHRVLASLSASSEQENKAAAQQRNKALKPQVKKLKKQKEEAVKEQKTKRLNKRFLKATSSAASEAAELMEQVLRLLS